MPLPTLPRPLGIRASRRPEGVRSLQLSVLADSAPQRERPGAAEEGRAAVREVRAGVEKTGMIRLT